MIPAGPSEPKSERPKGAGSDVETCRDFDTSDYHHRTCSLPRLSLEFVADKAIAVTSLSL